MSSRTKKRAMERRCLTQPLHGEHLKLASDRASAGNIDLGKGWLVCGPRQPALCMR